MLYGGKVVNFEGDCEDVSSPVVDASSNERIIIGRTAQMDVCDGEKILKSAKVAWDNGAGTWPQMTANERIGAMKRVVESLKEVREEIVHVLTWEIAKSVSDAEAEFDRTVAFVEATMEELRVLDCTEGAWREEGGYLAKVRRGPRGIVLNLGPFNYPFNETYAMLVPALLMGNVVIMKLPSTGGLAHVLTMEVYAKHLPPGAINFLSGSGRELVGPIMSTGDIDVLTFIGGAKAADKIIQSHPHPHRLKLFLQLESKNIAIVMPDADLTTAVKEITTGATNFNGQRCTALKLIFVHKSLVRDFLPRFVSAVSGLRWGNPWEEGVTITPLPEVHKIEALKELMQDAVNLGAQVINAEQGGGECFDAIMRPAILYPVTSEMRLWHEEQFGPVIPVAEYDNLQEVMDHIKHMPYGQQASLFTAEATASCTELFDTLANVVTRVNFNAQCSRSPDTLPFAGRRSSALGTMSVQGALRELSVEVVAAAKLGSAGEGVLRDLGEKSKFLEPIAWEDGQHRVQSILCDVILHG